MKGGSIIEYVIRAWDKTKEALSSALSHLRSFKSESKKVVEEAEENSKYCWQHIKGASQCQALTKDGAKCKRKAQPGKKYCWQHANYKPEAKKPAAKGAAKKPVEKPAAK